MGLYDEVVEPSRRTMTLFFVVDTSGSMGGENGKGGTKIGEVNSAIEDVIPDIQDISATNADSRIKVAALTFSTGAEWIQEPVEAENFRWTDLVANGVTDLGAACEQLNEKLSRKEYMSDVSGSFAPAIFLMSDGAPTDDYMRGLEKLKQNNWFKAAIKVAIAIGKDANESVLADFTGNSEAVITVHTPGELRKWIKFVSVTASKIGSSSSKIDKPGDDGSSGEDDFGSKQDAVIAAIKTEEENIEDTWEANSDGIVW